LLLLLVGCATSGANKPTPEAAQRMLKLKGYDFNGKSFLEAVANSDQTAITAFVDAGIDVNARVEPDGQTALILAATQGDVEAVKRLLRSHADPNVTDARGSTPLFRALAKDRDDVASILLAQPGLDLNARGLNGVTALIAYASRDRDAEVKNLVERGADVKLQDGDGDTALHVAARNGNVGMMELLLGKGAEVNGKNKVGGTALMWAAVYGHEDAIRFLLAHGADPSLKDADGVTAAGWAAKNKRDSVVEILKGK
jgi:ankyrin repeat protein